MKVKMVKIGLIGFGFMGTTHWGVYQGIKGAKVAAMADLEPAKRKGDISKVVGNIGGGDNSKPIDLTGVAVYKDGFELIAKADVDIVDICVPTPCHAELAIAALVAALRKPEVGGWARASAAGLSPQGGYGVAVEVDRCTKEMALARALMACGDAEDVGRRTLESYARDPRGVYAEHANAILAKY